MGPYALPAFVGAVFAGEVNASAPVPWTILITAYQKSGGNFYTSPNDVFESRYATGNRVLAVQLEPAQ